MLKIMPHSFISMSKAQLLDCPKRGWSEDIGPFNSLVLVPLRTRHDSGYRFMEFVAIKEDFPFKRLSGCSDVMMLGGYFNRASSVNWTIDCLPISGLFNLFHMTEKLHCGLALSSFEIFTETEYNRRNSDAP